MKCLLNGRPRHVLVLLPVAALAFWHHLVHQPPLQDWRVSILGRRYTRQRQRGTSGPSPAHSKRVFQQAGPNHDMTKPPLRLAALTIVGRECEVLRVLG